MKIEVHLCDVCKQGLDADWPLHFSAHPPAWPVSHWVDADFCSVDCLNSFVINLYAHLPEGS